MEKLRFFVRAMLGGIIIGVGGTVHLLCANAIVGSVLFCVGLFTICVFGLGLYTGMTGYVFDGNRRSNYVNLILCWVGNFVGCFISAMLVRTAANLITSAEVLAAAKLAKSAENVFCTAILCGALMFIAVENYRSSEAAFTKFLGMLFCVPVFILSGFEHSVANMFFLSAAHGFAVFSSGELLLIVISSAGNLLGGLGFKVLWKFGRARV